MTTGNRDDDDNCAYVYKKAERMRCGRSREQHRVPGLSHGFVSPEWPEGTIAFTDGTLRDAKDTSKLAPPQPAPETGGEWSVRDFDFHQYGDITLNETQNGVTVAFAYMQGRGPEVRQRAAQIVAEHNWPQRLTTALEGEEFYNLMQTYRLAPVSDQNVVVAAFEQVKAFIRDAAVAAASGNWVKEG